MSDEQADTAPGGGPDDEYVIALARDVVYVQEYGTDSLPEALSRLRAALAAPSREAGLDVEGLFAELRHTLETAPAWEWDEHAGNNYLHRSNVLAIVDEQYAITLRLTDPDADGAPFPAGVNRADSEGER